LVRRAGIVVTVALVLLGLILVVVFSRLAGRRAFPTTPLLALGAMALSTLAFAISSYWNCHDARSAFFAPLSWTIVASGRPHRHREAGGRITPEVSLRPDTES